MKNVDELKQKIEKKVFMRKLIVCTVNLFLYFNDKGNNSQCLWKVLKIALKIPQNSGENSLFLSKSLRSRLQLYEISHRRCSLKLFFFNFAIFTRKHLCWSLFSIKLQASRSVALLNKDSNIGVFLWVLRNF